MRARAPNATHPWPRTVNGELESAVRKSGWLCGIGGRQLRAVDECPFLGAFPPLRIKAEGPHGVDLTVRHAVNEWPVFAQSGRLPPTSFVRPSVRPNVRVVADDSINFGRSDGRTEDMIVGVWGPEPRPAPRHGRSSPFRRPTTAPEEMASYINASAVKRASTAPFVARMQYEMRP